MSSCQRFIISSKKVHQSGRASPGFFYGYVVVGAHLTTIMAMWAPYYAFGVFFKPVLTELGWTRALTSGAFSLAMITHGLLAIIMGTLNDKFGPRMVITLSGCLLGLGYSLMSLVNTVWQLYLFYGVIIGAGMGGAFVPHVSTVARWFVKRRSLMTGIVAAGTGIGILVGPLIATQLVSIYDWRVSYIIMGGSAWLVIVLIAQLLRRDPAQVGQQPYGESEGEQSGLGLEAKSFSLKEALHTKQFWLFGGLCFSFGFCLFTSIVHVVPYATDLGISAAGAANIMVTIGVLSIVGKVVLGGAGDRIGNKQALIISFTLWSLAYSWLLIATEEWMLYLFAAAFGIAYGGNSTSQSPLVARLFGLSSHGLIFGVLGLAVAAGGALGPFIAGYMFDATGSYQSAFMLCVIIGIVGVILTALLKPTKVETAGKNE
jgi:MFS family permease